MSSLSWIAYSDAERRQTLDVIAQLADQGTVDQLGLGRIRDAFANLLFPGTSTIQSRAKYFLLIPWMYKDLERRSPVSYPAERARRHEIDLIRSLVRGSGEEESLGIIGKHALDTLVQLPSQIYWGGLQRWGIRRYPGDPAAYHRLLGRANLSQVERDDDGAVVAGAGTASWDPHLPDPPERFLESVSIDLEPHESAYLRDCLSVHLGDSALADLTAAQAPVAECPYPWAVPDEVLRAMSRANQELLHNAEMYSLVMHGAALLYNRMLAELTERTDDQRRHEESYSAWSVDVDQRRGDIAEWHDGIDRFWELAARANPRIPSYREKRFVEGWCARALEADGERLAADPSARQLIRDRERETKGANGRFVNKSALEAWGGFSGASRFDFRWGLVRQFLSDFQFATPKPIAT